MRLHQSLSLTLLTKVAIFLLGIATSIILARILGPAGRGEYAIVILVPTIAIVLFNLGISDSIIHMVGSKKYKIEEVFYNSIIFASILGTVAIVIIIFSLDYIKSHYLHSLSLMYSMIALIAIPFFLLSGYLRSIHLGMESIGKFNFLELGRSCIYLLFLIITLFLFKLDVLGAIISWILTTVVICFTSIFLLRSRLTITKKYSFNNLRSQLVFGLKHYLPSISSFLHYRVDLLLILYFSDNEQVGLYIIAVGLGEMFLYIPSSVQLVLAPHIASSKSTSPSEVTTVCERNLCLLMLILLIIFLQIDKILINIAFGQAFLSAYLPLRYLLPGIFALSLSKVLSADFIGRGKPEVTTLASSVALSLNVVLNLVLIPTYGIIGAAIASSISYSTQTFILTFLFLQATPYRLQDLFIISKKDIKLYREIYTTYRTANR
jgi:O-antigen/teichoic acid export membrane protein